MYKITAEQQLKELTSRLTPIVNVCVIVHRKNKFLIGHRNPSHGIDPIDVWLFPGGRMKFTETLQEAAVRKLHEELPGVDATLKKLVTIRSDYGSDARANGIAIYYLFDHNSGEPKPNDQLDGFRWETLVGLDNNEKFYPMEKKIASEIIYALKFINTNSDELIVRVDENDNIIGEIDKLTAHNDRNIYHRSALIVVYNSKGNVILHQRSFMKSSGAGKWDVFGGHNNIGLTIDQTAKLELLEELGIETQLEFKFKKLYRKEKQSEFMYIYKTESDGPYAFDRNEVEQVKEFEITKLLNGGYDSEYDFLPHVKEFITRLESE